MLSDIRAFFAEREVLEVETPLLSAATVTDLHLEGFSTQFTHPLSPQRQILYLQTSPEYAMKRLLCAGCGPIFQICKAFRNEEAGRHHNPEFTMLEWYRPGFTHWQLMDEVDELVQRLLGTPKAEQTSYQQAFEQHTGLDPLSASLPSLCALAQTYGFDSPQADRDTLLNLLFSLAVEPKIGQDRPVLVHSFPASQAALAKIDPEDPRVAQRFELYYRGLELANGFNELQDAAEQRRRFETDNQLRQACHREPKPIDEHLLSALEQGLPACAGVAMGLDRILMLATDKTQINDVLAFSIDNA